MWSRTGTSVIAAAGGGAGAGDAAVADHLSDAKENKSFKDYLSGWHDRVPAEHKPFVRKVAAEFGFDLPEK